MGLNFGIEYELEDINTDARSYQVPGWYLEHDGTLREQGIEFVLREKMNIDGTKDAVRALLDTIGDDYSVSHRCSTHIHIDTQDLHPYARISLLLGLIAHDELFFQYGGERHSNSFCCPVYRSPNTITAINRAYRAYSWTSEGPTIGTLARNTPALSDIDTKYMSINTMPLTNSDLGTIELRHFVPLMDKDKMYEVLDVIECLYNVACKVPKGGRAAASEVWTGHSEEFPNMAKSIAWVQSMYKTHSDMLGVQ